jgi:hypothetical protein
MRVPSHAGSKSGTSTKRKRRFWFLCHSVPSLFQSTQHLSCYVPPAPAVNLPRPFLLTPSSASSPSFVPSSFSVILTLMMILFVLLSLLLTSSNVLLFFFTCTFFPCTSQSFSSFPVHLMYTFSLSIGTNQLPELCGLRVVV